jgi:type IV secretory pathway VirB2 component (pilin)
MIAVAQFAGALLVTLGLLASFGLHARTLVVCNLITGGLLLIAGLAAVWGGRASLSPRLKHVLPKLGLLLVPVAFTGWADHAAPLRSHPDLRAVLACSLPLALLLALQSTAFVPALTPTASECPEPAPQRARDFTYLVLAFVFLFLLLALPARAMLASLDDAFHSHAGLLIPFLAAAYALNGIHCALAPSLHLSRRAATLPVLGIAAAGLNVGLNLLLIPALGALGAVSATLLTFLGLAAATYHFAQQIFPTEYEQGRIAKILAAAAIVYLGALRWPVTASWPWLGAHLAAVLIAFPVILALAGFFRPGEKAFLRRLLPAS